jgi:hypothetical protein
VISRVLYAIIVAVLHITLRTRTLVWLVAFLLADSEGVKTKKQRRIGFLGCIGKKGRHFSFCFYLLEDACLHLNDKIHPLADHQRIKRETNINLQWNSVFECDEEESRGNSFVFLNETTAFGAICLKPPSICGES